MPRAVLLAMLSALGCGAAESPPATSAPVTSAPVTSAPVTSSPVPSTRPTAPPTAAWPAPAGHTPALEPPAAAPPRARFLAVGDVMLSRGVAAHIRDRGDPGMVFAGMGPIFSRVDFVFANLEFPFAQKTVVPVRGNVFNAPSEWVGGLVDHRFRVLNLANNHAMDQGEQGLFDTIALLRSRDLLPFGAGHDEGEAWTPAEIEIEGIRIGFVGASYASINDSGDTWLRFVARIEDKPRLEKVIAELRTRVDFVVATMHAGIEYVPVPFGPQILFGKAAIDAGADIVIGAHPHVVQPVEIYQGRYIFHSLGNFIFDQTDRHTDEGAAVEITLSRANGADRATLERLEVLPVVIVDGTPRPAPDPVGAAILERMKLSDALLPPYPEN